ncbi:Protein lifeguard 3 [Liparis tanakae]|uniref:Protein lifeguard 3 n=1 Tax=Liparis tanakae TaxID=230148 RepID=A0A4Z2JFG6_9TELE|nr:Protein lifeguard 3 [Liparis tanakae]
MNTFNSSVAPRRSARRRFKNVPLARTGELFPPSSSRPPGWTLSPVEEVFALAQLLQHPRSELGPVFILELLDAQRQVQIRRVAAQERIVLPLFPDGGGTLATGSKEAALLKMDVRLLAPAATLNHQTLAQRVTVALPQTERLTHALEAGDKPFFPDSPHPERNTRSPEKRLEGASTTWLSRRNGKNVVSRACDHRGGDTIRCCRGRSGRTHAIRNSGFSVRAITLHNSFLQRKIMTSKTDNPPPYDDALHHPKYGNYPHQPQPGSPLPPPPSYSPSPGMDPGPPGYWGQQGVNPPAGMRAASGYSASGMVTTIPTLSAGVSPSNQGSEEMTQDLGEMEDLLSTQWESTSVRHAFIRKVDFTSCGGILCIASVALMIIGIVTAVVLSFQYRPFSCPSTGPMAAYALRRNRSPRLYSVYNTQLLIGNRESAISPEEYVYGALSLYIDIVHIFLFILQSVSPSTASASSEVAHGVSRLGSRGNMEVCRMLWRPRNSSPDALTNLVMDGPVGQQLSIVDSLGSRQDLLAPHEHVI